MQSKRIRIRKDFSPLTVAVSLRCTTPASPTTQVLNGSNGEYEPERELTPTVILPEVSVNSSDGSWGNPSANHALADMRWFVNGEDISTLSDWTDKYAIEQIGSSRGSISISRNVSPGELVQLRFEAVLSDLRLGVNIPIVSEEILLTTIEKSEDRYSISTGDSSIIRYDPIKDMLSLYEYKVAHGLQASSPSDEIAATDKSSYRHTISVAVFKGKSEMSSGYSLRFYRVSSATTLTELAAGSEELESITSRSVTLDLRLVSKASYVIKAFVGSGEVAMLQFGVSRIYRSYNISPTNGTSIHPTDTERYDEAKVDCDGNVVEFPGRVFRIVWFTDTSAQKSVEHNEGDSTLFRLDKTGIGNSYNDSVLEVYCTAEYKAEHKFATDGSNFYTDKSGNKYIFH